MNRISSLQQKVNKIVSDAGLDSNAPASLEYRAYLCRPDGDRVWAYVCSLWVFLGMKGVSKCEGEFQALVWTVAWKLYLWWLKRDLARRPVVNVLLRVGMEKQAVNFRRCGFHVFNMKCLQCGYVHEVIHHCKLRVCPECKRVREWEVVESYRDALLSLGKLRKFELTIKNVSDLDAGVKKLRACFKKLRLSDKRQSEKWGLSCKSGYRSLLWGGLYGIEAPLGNDGLWNVHLHCVYAGVYIKQSDLADDWERITGDSRIVYIKEVKNVEQDIGYVAKYACKQSGALLEDGEKFGEYMSVLYKVRLVQPFGSLLGKKASKDVFVCPECGGCVWLVIEVATGRVVFDGLEYLRARASPGLSWDGRRPSTEN